MNHLQLFCIAGNMKISENRLLRLTTDHFFGGTGSYPCVPHGWHFEIRLAPSQNPLNGPCILMASMAYCEHVGSCLHDAGVNGEMAYL
jgi:hypothetical protein